MARFELYQDTKKDWRWRFVSLNGRIIAVSSEGYRSEADCVNSIHLVQDEAAAAPVNQIVAAKA